MPKDPQDDAPFTLPADGADTPPSIPEPGQAGEQSKVRVILGLLKRLMGVSDVANLRLSLPASLLEPIPNLEYWSYCDRADFFAAIGDSPDEFERILSVLRFAFSKELKFVRQRIGKPYNSALGEHFRCHWRVPPISIHPHTREPLVRTYLHDPADDEPLLTAAGGIATPSGNSPALGPADGSDEASIRSFASKTSARAGKPVGPGTLLKSMSNLSLRQGAQAAPNGNGNENSETTGEQVVVFLCEQVSHHPPISSAYYACPEKGVEMTCVDQISAKVSGMTVQVTPGEANKGLFISLSEPSQGAGEEYQVTHPIAQVNGILKGTFYGTIGDKVIVTCRGGKPGMKLKAIIEYRDESWIGKPKFALEGVVFSYNPDKADEKDWSKIKQVPSDRVVANIEGSWRKQIKYRRKGEKEWILLIDLAHLGMTPRSVRPLSEQEERESRRLWDPVTTHMNVKNWSEATKQKQSIEQRQRDIAHELKQKGIEHQPVYFEQDISSGKPTLSEEGRKAVEAELERARREQA